MSTSTYQERLEASADHREWLIRQTKAPWAYQLQELVLVALSAVYPGPVEWKLYQLSEQLDGFMNRRVDVDVEEARLVLGVAWEAEMEREARIARRGW